MKKKSNFLKKLPFTEKILLIFMTIIYSQIIYNLLFNEINNDNTSPIDTIVRTAASSIFGYFLGANIEVEDKNDNKETKTTYNKTKENTIIIAVLGIVSLLIMLIIRNFSTLNYSSIASISQLKDFVSASVGYLVSKQNQKE